TESEAQRGRAWRRDTDHVSRPQSFALRSSRNIVVETVHFDQEIADEFAANQMLLDDPFEHGWIAGTIPGPFRIDHGNRSALTDSQAIGFRAQDAALFRESQFLEPPLEIVPGFEAASFLTAFRSCLIGTQENVA